MPYVGHVAASSLPFRRGDQVVIPAGVTVTSTNPSRRSYKTTRKQRVTAVMVMEGCSVHPSMTNFRFQPGTPEGDQFEAFRQLRETANTPEAYQQMRDFRIHMSNPSISWAGTGGYWCDVEINDLLEANGKS